MVGIGWKGSGEYVEWGGEEIEKGRGKVVAVYRGVMVVVSGGWRVKKVGRRRCRDGGGWWVEVKEGVVRY